MTVAIALLSPSDLIQQHRHASYLILDARPYAHYRVGHIPGAIWIGWEAWCEEAPLYAGRTLARAGYWGVLKAGPTGVQEEQLERLGVSNNRLVLVYDNGPHSKGRAARIAWMLLYWGISSVSLLNGGWRAWLRAGGSSDKAVPVPDQGHFRLSLQEQRRVQLSQLKQDMQRNTLPLLIDTRTREEFAGYRHAYQPRLGSLPGAIHVPFTTLFDETGNFVTKSVYLQRLPSEIQNAKRLVAYCEVGVRSCLIALLHELYTGQVVANFDGSIMQWALDRTLPMETDILSIGEVAARLKKRIAVSTIFICK